MYNQLSTRHLSLRAVGGAVWRNRMSTGEQKSELVSISQRLYYSIRVLLCAFSSALISIITRHARWSLYIIIIKFLPNIERLSFVSTTEQSAEGCVQSWRPSQDQATDRKRSRRPKQYIGQSAATARVAHIIIISINDRKNFCHHSLGTLHCTTLPLMPVQRLFSSYWTMELTYILPTEWAVWLKE